MAEREKIDSLSVLSDEILEKIVGKLDIRNRMKIRKVSKKFRRFIDQRNNKYEKIGIAIHDKFIILDIDNMTILYGENSPRGCEVQFLDRRKPVKRGKPKKTKIIENCNFYEIAVNDFKITMKSPALEIQRFVVDLAKGSGNKRTVIITHREDYGYRNFMESVKKFFSNHQIHVNYVEIRAARADDVPAIVGVLKPGILNNIEFKSKMSAGYLYSLFRMDQWKLAKSVVAGGMGRSRIPPNELQNFIYFDRFTVQLSSISTEDIIKIRDDLSKSANFEYCELTSECHDTIDKIGEALGVDIIDDTAQKIVHRHLIPDSDEFLEFTIEECESENLKIILKMILKVRISKKNEKVEEKNVVKTAPKVEIKKKTVVKIDKIDKIEVPKNFKNSKNSVKFEKNQEKSEELEEEDLIMEVPKNSKNSKNSEIQEDDGPPLLIPISPHGSEEIVDYQEIDNFDLETEYYPNQPINLEFGNLQQFLVDYNQENDVELEEIDDLEPGSDVSFAPVNSPFSGENQGIETAIESTSTPEVADSIDLLKMLRIVVRSLESLMLIDLQEDIEKEIDDFKDDDKKVPLDQILTAFDTGINILAESGTSSKPSRDDSTSLKDFLMSLRCALFSLSKTPSIDDFQKKIKDINREIGAKDKIVSIQEVRLILETVFASIT